jgi:hypothetical protein
VPLSESLWEPEPVEPRSDFWLEAARRSLSLLPLLAAAATPTTAGAPVSPPSATAPRATTAVAAAARGAGWSSPLAALAVNTLRSALEYLARLIFYLDVISTHAYTNPSGADGNVAGSRRVVFIQGCELLRLAAQSTNVCTSRPVVFLSYQTSASRRLLNDLWALPE